MPNEEVAINQRGTWKNYQNTFPGRQLTLEKETLIQLDDEELRAEQGNGFAVQRTLNEKNC